MEKIPSVFVRDQESPRLVTSEPTSGLDWWWEGLGTATEKFDGTACAVIRGQLYRRHHHKEEKGVPPVEWLHWSFNPETASGHGWLPVREGNPADRWHLEAWAPAIPDGTYELVGPKVQSNPYKLDCHELWQHSSRRVECVAPTRVFYALHDWFGAHPNMEGLVWHFHSPGQLEYAKLKRTDFGYEWPTR